METKSGYSGDNLLALKGHCERCGTEGKVYYARCNYEKGRLILSFQRTGRTNWKGTCEHCYVTKRLISTLRWEGVQDRILTDNELAIMNQNSDFSRQEVEQEVSRQTRNDKIGEEFMQENREKIDWQKSKSL